jgi:hypothetical protein
VQKNLSFKGSYGSLIQESLKNCARVHFIPNLKVGVFVTLRAPDVIKWYGGLAALL